jgi:hypothetical protein
MLVMQHLSLVKTGWVVPPSMNATKLSKAIEKALNEIGTAITWKKRW